MKIVDLPKQDYLKRMRIYFAEMFPITQRLLSSFLLYISFVMVLERIHRVKVTIYSSYTLVGTLSIFSLMLILRLMDELKDREVDRELFNGRPLPSGRVLESDIRLSLVVVITLYLAANILFAQVFLVAMCVLGYTLLMFKYFFIPRILRKYLLLNLLTHNPIVPIMLFYVLIFFSVAHGLSLRDLNWSFSFLLISMYWAMFFAWEIARKIRSKEEENAYVTYSQIFGPLCAVLVAGGAQTIAFAIGIYFFYSLSLPGVFLTILLVGYGIAMWGHARFITNPNPATSKLKPFAERYIVSVLVAQIVGNFA